MSENQISNYFVVSGVSESDHQFQKDTRQQLDPIIDIAVINRSNHEPVPNGYKCVEKTPYGHEANLNHGSIQGSKFFICYKRGREKPPLLDIGVFHCDSTERVSSECTIIKRTPSGFSANLNNVGSTKIYLTLRRSTKLTPFNQLVVTDICVILTSKNESPPHAFCLIDKNLNKGYFGYGSDAYLCYKKTLDRPPRLLYNPVIIDRYPYEENPEYSLPQNLPLFCLPMGGSIECWFKNELLPPSSSAFILTTSVGTKIYATSLNYHEKIQPQLLTKEELVELEFISENQDFNDPVILRKAAETKSIQRIKSLCVLSQWPFFDQFKSFLSFIYKNFVEKPSEIPIEHYVFHFMQSIPFPSPDRPNIMVILGPTHHVELLFQQTFDDFPIPSNGASFKKLLQNLGPENCLYLLLFVLTEQKILLHSLRLSILAELAEALVAMIFPFNWNCPYIPICPLNLAGVLNAPLPFIVGIYSQYFDHSEPPSDVISIDLDTKAIYLSDTKRILNPKLMPKKETRHLQDRLEEIHRRIEDVDKMREMDKQTRRKFEKQFEKEIQEAFLFFMASILKDFHHFLKPITAAPKVGATDPSSLFDFDGFLQAHEANISFYTQLTKTQMFTKFIEERSLVSDKNISLAFFDDCIEKIEKYEKLNLKKGSKLNLLNFHDPDKSSKTVFISIPFSNAEFGRNPEPRLFDGRFQKELFRKLENEYPTKAVVVKPCSLNDCPDGLESGLDSELQCYAYAKRAKHEVLKALKIAQQSRRSSSEWAKCLLINAYSLWFTHFPAFSYELGVKINNKAGCLGEIKPLSIAYRALQRMQMMDFSVPDEFCYRILMILCIIHSRPALAVKIFLDMKKYNVKLNAITYGYYNKAVLDGHWPTISTDCQKNAKWIKLFNVIRVVLHFKRHIKSLNLESSSDPPILVAETVGVRKKFTFSFTGKAGNSVNHSHEVIIMDYCPSAGLLWIPDRFVYQDENQGKKVIKLNKNRKKRNKSGDAKTKNISKEELNKLLDDLMKFKIVKLNNVEQKISKIKVAPEATTIASKPKLLSKDELGESSDSISERNRLFSDSFVAPLKETLVNIDFSKSPVADRLRSSFRIAKNFTKSKYSFARSTLYDSDKNINRMSSLFGKSEANSAKVKTEDDLVRTPPRLPRSSTLPQWLETSKASTLFSTPVNETMNEKSQFQTYGMGSPSDYFYSTFKSIGGRFSELKLSLGGNVGTNSPVKFNMVNAVASRLNFKNDDENLNQSIDNLLDAFDENSFHMEKYQSILNEYYSQPLFALMDDPTPPQIIALSVAMISSTICRKCNSIIYDEEIMCKWFADDSDLNTSCIHCKTKFVPSLTICVKDYRNAEKSCENWDPISVPYLSPLVLRKELENILNAESYSSLIRPKFVDNHPIVYWNLVWYFMRLNLPSYINGLALTSSKLNSPEKIQFVEENQFDFKNVSVIGLWDDEKFYESMPLHHKWLKVVKIDQNDLDPKWSDFKNLCEELVELIREKNLTKPIQFLISERSKRMKQSGTKQQASLYRELLFLNLLQHPPALDCDSFDEEYRNAFESLISKDKESLLPIDDPLPKEAIFCRNLFKPLSLLNVGQIVVKQ